MNILNKLGLGSSTSRQTNTDPSPITQGPDDDAPAPGNQFAQFGAGCFWNVELAYQRVPGVTQAEVGYSQGLHTIRLTRMFVQGQRITPRLFVFSMIPKDCTFESLLDLFWSRHDPTTLNRQVQQYLSKGGRFGLKQSAAKGCNDPIRCYG